MAIISTKLYLKPSVLPRTIAADPADQLEATAEYTYNLYQDTTRTGYTNYGNSDSTHTYWDSTPSYINAQGGDDTIIFRFAGSTTVHAGSGNDTVEAGGGDDTLYGGSGDDRLSGNAGRDALKGGSGSDVLAGGTENDQLFGGSGKDFLYGGQDADTLQGGSGDDEIYGDAYWSDYDFNRATWSGTDEANDVLSGGTGNDLLVGGDGADIMTGGTGADTFQYKYYTDFDSATATDYITDFNAAEGDKIDFFYIDGEADGGGILGHFWNEEREPLTFHDGESEEERSIWLGEVDANGDQKVFINWDGGTFDPGPQADHMIKVHVGVGQTLHADDFLF